MKAPADGVLTLAFGQAVAGASEGATCVTSGLDIGARSVKIAVLAHRGMHAAVLASAVVQIQGCRDDSAARAALRESWGRVLAEANLSARDVDFMASTGTRDRQIVRAGHFYRHPSQALALGARLLFPDATVALDIGLTHVRCDLLGSPLGGPRRILVCREAGRGDDSLDALGRRAATLLHSLAIDGKVVLTGGIVRDADFVHNLWSRLLAAESKFSLLISPDAIFAGAYGAAILAARRFRRLSRPVGLPVVEASEARMLSGDDRSLN
jgi:benzoyl-CoA reductase subunit D